MLCLSQLTEGDVRQIRKTAEDPPRVSVIDTIAAVCKQDPRHAAITCQRLSQNYPEVFTNCTHFKFSGQGQRETPIADARCITEIIMVLPGRVAGQYRKQAADIVVRYMGGDLSLVDEIAANRLRQEELDDEDPRRIFGQTVESEAVKRAREEAEVAELQNRTKRARLQEAQDRVQSAAEVARLTLSSLQDLGLPICDRDRALCKDIITTAAFAGQALEDAPGEKDICLQQFCMERGRAGKHAQLGKAAKKLYVRDHPGYEFPKKDVYCNGQLIPVNRWTESMRPYLERALAEL